MRLTPIFIVASTLALVASACGGGTETRVRESAATGVEALDFTLNSALAGDQIELAGLTGYQEIGCVADEEGSGSPPVCREDESAGDEVEAFPVLRCELMWVRPEVVPDVYAEAFAESAELVTVYRPVERPLVLDADYVAVFDTNADDDTESGVALSIKEGRVIQLEYNCNDFAELYADEKVAEFVIAPDGVDVTPTADDGDDGDDEA